MKIDIRSEIDYEVESIRYSDCGIIKEAEYNDKAIRIYEYNNYIRIYKSDIDNLIKALQKAKELWT